MSPASRMAAALSARRLASACASASCSSMVSGVVAAGFVGMDLASNLSLLAVEVVELAGFLLACFLYWWWRSGCALSTVGREPLWRRFGLGGLPSGFLCGLGGGGLIGVR